MYSTIWYNFYILYIISINFNSCTCDLNCDTNIGECSTSEYEDANGDGYDDVSYDAGVESVDITVDNQEAYDAGAESGDINLDGTNDVLDVVLQINIILGN